MTSERAAALEAAFARYDLPWRKTFGDRQIRCPLGTHDDKHPSATVNTETGLWNCFTCGEGGDGYTLVMRREGLGFREAKQALDGSVDGDGTQVRGQLDGGMGLLPRRKGHPVKRDLRRRSWLGD